MSYRCEQKIGNGVYVYEVESYWDSEKHQARQRRTYLGKKDPQSGKLVKKQVRSAPRASFDFGTVYFLQQLSRKLGLEQVLQQVFPDCYTELLHLAWYKLLEGKAFYLYAYWRDASYLPDAGKLDSQRISELLAEVGKGEKRIEQFFQEWIERNAPLTTIMFDITSVSSYSENIDYVEYGYNRDKEELEQINLGVLLGEPTGIPLCYRIYPGSITDVVTLSNIVRFIQHYGLGVTIFVMDKGFYSKVNLEQMHAARLKFIIPLSFGAKIATDLAKSCSADLPSVANGFSFNGQVLFHTKTKVQVGRCPLIAHVYHDETRKAHAVNKLFTKITDLEDLFTEKRFKDKAEAEDYIQESLKTKKKLFAIRKSKGQFKISRNHLAIAECLIPMGKLVIATNVNQLDKVDILSLYRQKDEVEKVFLSLKHDLNEDRLRVKSAYTMKGKVFVLFLALILRMYIRKIAVETGLAKKLTLNKIFLELKKLKAFAFADNTMIVTEVSKTQKTIFSAFKIRIPKELTPTSL